MSLAIHQTTETRRRAVDLLCAIRADEPGAGLPELAEVALCVWLDSRGTAPPQARRHPQGRPPRLDALDALSRGWLVLPADRRTRALTRAAIGLGDPEPAPMAARLSVVWAEAIDHLHALICAAPDEQPQGRAMLYRMAA